MKLIFYISVFIILTLVKVKEKTEIRSNRPKLRWKEKVMWKGDKFRRIWGPTAHIQLYPFSERRVMDV